MQVSNLKQDKKLNICFKMRVNNHIIEEIKKDFNNNYQNNNLFHILYFVKLTSYLIE